MGQGREPSTSWTSCTRGGHSLLLLLLLLLSSARDGTTAAPPPPPPPPITYHPFVLQNAGGPSADRYAMDHPTEMVTHRKAIPVKPVTLSLHQRLRSETLSLVICATNFCIFAEHCRLTINRRRLDIHRSPSAIVAHMEIRGIQKLPEEGGWWGLGRDGGKPMLAPTSRHSQPHRSHT